MFANRLMPSKAFPKQGLFRRTAAARVPWRGKQGGRGNTWAAKPTTRGDSRVSGGAREHRGCSFTFSYGEWLKGGRPLSLLRIAPLGWAFLGMLLWSNGGTLRGQTLQITDGATGEALEQVLVRSEALGQTALSDGRGKVDLKSFAGAEQIQFNKLGYATEQRSFAELRQQDWTLALQPSNFNLDEVVVSATRWRESSSEVSAKVATLSPREVQLENPQTTADLLESSGKVFMQKSQQGGGSPMIRGFATNRLLYTIDGVRMNTAIFRGGNLQNVISLDPFSIERTEVFFGPGSVIYGSDAIGGVMSFETLEPRFALAEEESRVEGGVVARLATANQERSAHAEVMVGGQRWAMATSISTQHYGPLRQGRHGPEDYLKDYHVRRIDSADVVVEQDDPLLQIPSGYDQHNFLQKLRFRPDDEWDLQYGFHYSETSSYGRYDRHNRMRNGRPRYGQWDYGPQIWSMHHLEAQHQPARGLYDQLTLRLARQRFEESRIDRSWGSLQQRNRIEEVLAHSANLDFTKRLGRHELSYGLEGLHNRVRSQAFREQIFTGSRQALGSRYPQAEWASLAAYLLDHFRISEKWSLQGGLRYNHFDIRARFDTGFYDLPFDRASLSPGALTGHLGLIHRPGDQTVLKAQLSTGFRAPNVDDIGKVFDSEPGTVVVPNPDLQPEYAYNGELSWTQILGETLKLDLTAYYTLLRNAMVRRPYRLGGRDSIPYDGVPSRVEALQNAARARVYGLQLGAELKLPADWSLALDANYQEGSNVAEDGRETPVRHVAPIFGRLSLSYRASRDLQWQLYSRFQGQRLGGAMPLSERGKTDIYALDAQGRPYAPAWYTLNLKMMYQLSEAWSFTAGLENMTDQRYRPYSSGLSGAGRNFNLALRMEF